MNRHRSVRPWVRFAVAVCLLFAAVGAQPVRAIGDNVASSAQPVSSDPDDANPDATTPDDTNPDDTNPDDTNPDDTNPDDGTAVGSDDGADDEDLTALTWLAVIATLALVAVATWWMARHGAAERRVGRMDDDWPGDSDVI